MQMQQQKMPVSGSNSVSGSVMTKDKLSHSAAFSFCLRSLLSPRVSQLQRCLCNSTDQRQVCLSCPEDLAFQYQGND